MILSALNVTAHNIWKIDELLFGESNHPAQTLRILYDFTSGFVHINGI